MSKEAGPPLPGSEIPETLAPSGETSETGTAMAGRLYRVDSSRSSFVELWRDTRSPLVLIAWISKLLRLKLPGSVNDPNVVSLWPFVLPDEAIDKGIPAQVWQKFDPVLRELTDLGFSQPVYFSIKDLFHHSHTCQAALLHRDGRSLARVTHRVEGVQGSKVHFFTEYVSLLGSGRFACSSSARAQSLVPPVCELNWNHRATPSQLWVSHRQHLDAAVQEGDAVVPMNSREEMVDVLESHHEAARDFNLERGVFSSMQGDDLVQAEALDKSLEQVRSGQSRHPEIMAQLERLQTKQTSWTSAILVLIVSIALFAGAGAGAWDWSWEMLLMIVSILLVHEAGHYAAMKIFNYRNVRMFFIPFFGAAVSGQHYTAPGWKKVVVALMGPLPGIFLGGVLGIAGLIKGNDLMMKVSMMALILNGFQLLPVLPLDGGRVMHAILFCRHYLLDTIFQVLAAGTLAGIGVLSGDKFLMYLGGFMLLSAPLAYKVAKIANELRQAGLGQGGGVSTGASYGFAGAVSVVPRVGSFGTASPQPVFSSVPPTAPTPIIPIAPILVEDHSIPQPVAETIIDRIRARFPRLKSPKQVAELTLRVYEMLATRPPGVAASIGFLFLHGAAFIAALVLLAVPLVSKNWDLMNLIAAYGADPEHSVDPDAIVTWAGPETSGSASSGDAAPAKRIRAATREHDTIVASFASFEDARRAFDDVKQEMPVSASIVLFGQSVLLSLPSSDEPAHTKWFTEMESRTEDVFVDGGDARTSLELTCQTASDSQAEAIAKELGDFLQIPAALCLIPPWVDDDLDRRTPEDRERHEAARETYLKLQRVLVSDAPELKKLRDRLARASRRNNQTEYRRLSKEMADLENRLRVRELERLRDSEKGSIHRELADRYIGLQMAEPAAENDGGPESSAASGPENDSNAADAVKEDEDATEDYAEFRRKQEESNTRQRMAVGPLMGQLAVSDDGGRPAARTMRYSQTSGYAHKPADSKLAVYITFEDAAHGAPALLKWLRKRGCREFKYEFRSGGMYEYGDD